MYSQAGHTVVASYSVAVFSCVCDALLAVMDPQQPVFSLMKRLCPCFSLLPLPVGIFSVYPLSTGIGKEIHYFYPSFL